MIFSSQDAKAAKGHGIAEALVGGDAREYFVFDAGENSVGISEILSKLLVEAYQDVAAVVGIEFGFVTAIFDRHGVDFGIFVGPRIRVLIKGSRRVV